MGRLCMLGKVLVLLKIIVVCFFVERMRVVTMLRRPRRDHKMGESLGSGYRRGMTAEVCEGYLRRLTGLTQSPLISRLQHTSGI